ncbi:MAG: hypothetical protein DWQ05_00185 [Calditrichaeota bacterium]|nr:MAG: hypothetical protein DWQ05_00185 [Calditrichota bacterium]
MVSRTTRLRALQNHIRRIENRASFLQERSDTLSTARLVIFVVGIAATAIIFYTAGEFYSGLVFAVLTALFIILAYHHRKIDGSLKSHTLWLSIKKSQVARMQLDWKNIPLPPHNRDWPEHPFHPDLDIIGFRSLHHVLDTTISTDGSARLQSWLLNTRPQKQEILQRQKIIAELTPKALFRDKLQLAFRLISGEVLDSNRLLNWLGSRRRPASLRWLLPSMSILAILNITLFITASITGWQTYWLVTLITYGLLYFFNQNPIKSLLTDAVFLEDEITVFRGILFYLERYPYQKNQHLEKICQPFRGEKSLPSAQLRFIKTIATAVGLRMNPLVGFGLNLVLPWDFYCAHFLENCKDKLRETVPIWMESLIELEALNSLANFAYLNPGNTQAQILDDGGSSLPIFSAQKIWHPLIPVEQAVCNDFNLQKTGDLVIITGSNMSGKSTFLKTIGINLCLAFAGSPVCAHTFSTSLFRIFTCLRVNDSIIEGFSFFYSEVRRLKSLLNATQNNTDIPVFFFIDEIFRGTNNRERLIGSRSFIRALIGTNSIGCVSTHDLELIHLAEEIENIANFHFREHIENQQMVFDYLLKEGPCPTTNALEIMRIEGLPVDDTA